MSMYSAKDIGLDLPVAAQGNDAGQGLYGASDIGLAHLDVPAPANPLKNIWEDTKFAISNPAVVGKSIQAEAAKQLSGFQQMRANELSKEPTAEELYQLPESARAAYENLKQVGDERAAELNQSSAMWKEISDEKNKEVAQVYEPKSWLGKVGKGVVASAPPTLAGFALSTMVGPTAGGYIGIGLGSLASGSSAYRDRIDAGAPHDEALLSATRQGILEWIGERIALGSFVDMFKAAKAGAKITPAALRNMGTEAIQESLTAVGQGAEQAMAEQNIDPLKYKGLGEYIKSGKILNDALEGFVGGSLMSGAMAPAIKAIQVSYKPLAKEAAQQMDVAIKAAEAAGSSTVSIGDQEIPLEELRSKYEGIKEAYGLSEEDVTSIGQSAIESEEEAKLQRATEGLKDIHRGEAAHTVAPQEILEEPIDLATEATIVEEAPKQKDYQAEFDTFSQRDLTDTQVVRSTRVDSGFAKILQSVHNQIGTKANIALFSAEDFAGEEGSAFRKHLETQGHSVLDIKGGRVFQSEKDGKKFYTIVANTDTSLQARSAILMHEALGHITMMEHFDLAPAELQRSLLKEFALWKKDDQSPEGFLSFDSFNEDFGDPKALLWNSIIGRPGETRQRVNRRSFHEFMAHQLSSKMQQRPEVQGTIQKYWASLRAKINKMFEAFKAEYLDIATNVNSVDEFIDFLFKTGNYAEIQQDNVENLNSISETPVQVDEKTKIVQAVFDSMFEVVDGKRVLKNAWRFKKVFKDGNRSLVSRKDIESSGIYYKEERGKTVVYKNKEVLFTIPWDASRNLSAQSARLVATNLRDLYILATLQPSHVERSKANATKMLNTSTGKKVTVKMGSRAARTLEIMWERAATLAQEQGISERQAFLMIMSGEGSAFSSLRPGVAGTEATGSLRKNMDRWIAMHESDLSSMLQETPTAEPVQVEQELVKEHIEEPKQTALSAEVTQTIDQVRGIIETWWNKPKPSERVQDFEGLTQKVIFYFDLNGKDYTEVKPEIRNLIGATIKDVLQEKTGVEVQGEVKNKVVQRDKVLQMHKAGMDTTLEEAQLQSFDINISEEDLRQWAGTDNFVDGRSTHTLLEPSPDEMMDIMTQAGEESKRLADEHIHDGRFLEDVLSAIPLAESIYVDRMLKQDSEWQAIYSRLRDPNLDWRNGLAEFEALANRYRDMPPRTRIDIQKPNGEHMSIRTITIAEALDEFVANIREWHTHESDMLYLHIKGDLVAAASGVRPRYRYSKQDHAYIDQTTGEVIAFDPFNPGSMTEGFETGKPVAITNLFHGTTDDIHAFRSKHLGSLTGAQSAKMGFFMAADATVAGSYPMIMGKPRTLNRAAKIMNNYGRKVFVEIRDLIRSVLEPKRGDISWKDSKIVYGNIDVDTAKVLANDGQADIGYMALKDSAGRLIDRIGLGLVYDTNGNLGIDVDAPWKLEQALDGLPTGEIEQGKYFKKLEKKLGEFWNQATFGENYIDWGDPAIVFQGEPVPAGANVIKTVGKMQNPFVKDWKGGSYRDGGWSDGIREAKEKGHDGVIYLNAKDGVGYGHRIVTNIFVFFNGHQIKSDFATVGAFRSKSGKLVEKEKMPESFDLFGNYDRVTKILGEDLTLGSYTDSIDGFKKAYFSDRGISFVPLASGEKSPPGNGFIRPSWKRNSDAGKLTLWHVIEHEDLFAVYPELNNLKVKFFEGMGKAAGSADWENWTINVNYSRDTDTVRSIILHELQHIIQAQESWAGGQSMRGAKAFKDHLRLQRDRLGRDISTFIAINKMIKAGKSYQEAMSDYMQANRFNGIKLQSANYIATLAADMGWEKLSEELQQARVDAAKATIFDTGSAFEAYRHAAGEEEARRAEALFYLTDDEVRVAFRDRGIAAGSDISDRSLLYKTDARTLQVVLSATSTVEDTAQDELTYASYAMLDSFDLKISPKRRGQRKETTTGPYAGIIKQARKASKSRKPSVVDPLKMEKKRAALFSFLEKMDVIRERGEQLGLSTSEVMLKLGFAPDQVRKHIARYNKHKSKFSQNETIIRLAEIAGLINEETGRENLESLIKVMFPPTEYEEAQPDGTTKKVTDPGSDGSLQSLSTIGKDMLINKLQTIIASSTGSKFDIESEKSLGESIAEYKEEWNKTGRLKKLGGLIKYIQSSAADFLESTKSGQELSFRLRRYLLTKTVMQRNYLVELNDFARKYSSTEERQRFYEVISGERVAETDDERKFANLVKSINRSYGTEMQTLQVRVYKKNGSFTFFKYDQDMSDAYFPHMWKPDWFRNPTQDMIQSLLDSGEAQDRAHAKKLIQNFHKQMIRDQKFANVERARETELGGWITDPIEVYQKYVLGASARLASLREFGSTPEVVLAQLSIRHLKESRDPEALTKTRDLINRVLGTKIEDQLLKEPKAAMSFGVMYSVGLLLQHSMLVQPGVMANMGALGGYKNLVKGISAVLPALWGNNKGQMNKRWAELAGVLAFTVNRELNDIVMDDETRLKSDKILRSFGITQVDASMRIVGAIVGKLYATDVAMKYAEMGDAKSAQRLRRLGIDPRKITRDYLQSQEWYTKDLRMAALAFTEDTNFVLDPMRMPSIIQGHPLARILFLFKNFAFQQHRFLLRLLREDKGKAFKSLVGSLSGGALIMLVRMLLQGDDPEKILEKDGIAKTVWRAFMAGGGAGLFAEAIGSAVIPGSGPQTGMALDSPVFGLLETLGRGGKSLYNFAEGDATDQDMHNLYRSAIMALQGGALAMPAPVGVPLNAAIGFTRPLAERAIAPSDRQRETSYLQ